MRQIALHLSFIVSNKSAHDRHIEVGGDHRNDFGRPNSFAVLVAKASGELLVARKITFDAGGELTSKPLPSGGRFTYRLFLPHWVALPEPGEYRIVAGGQLASGKLGAKGEGKIRVEVQTSLKVLPPHLERLGRAIERYGEAMLVAEHRSNSHKIREARQALSEIMDERVIPYFRRAQKSRNYSLMFSSLRPLSKFTSDEALAGLMEGAATKPEDLESATLDGHVRHAAANALAQSVHPGAMPFLLTRRHDPHNGVRMTIVHTVRRKLPPDQAVAILKEMTEDQDPARQRRSAPLSGGAGRCGEVSRCAGSTHFDLPQK